MRRSSRQKHQSRGLALLALAALVASGSGVLAQDPPGLFNDGGIWLWDPETNSLAELQPGTVADIHPTGHVEFQATQHFFGDAIARIDLTGTYPTPANEQEPLPSIQGRALAIGNYMAIQSETATFFDISQVHAGAQGIGGGGPPGRAIAQATMANPPGVGPGQTAKVDLDVRAISNLLDIRIMAQDPNNVLIYKIEQDSTAATQIAHADVAPGFGVPVTPEELASMIEAGEDVTRTSTVSVMAVDNYTSLQTNSPDGGTSTTTSAPSGTSGGASSGTD